MIWAVFAVVGIKLADPIGPGCAGTHDKVRFGNFLERDCRPAEPVARLADGKEGETVWALAS